MNLFYCSTFIMNILDFWNLTLLYNFLVIRSMPKFAYDVMWRIINFYFTYNTLSIEMNKVLFKKGNNELLFNFKSMTDMEKINVSKKGYVWFGFLGTSSNFMSNNFDSLLLFVLFFVKCLIFTLLKKLIMLRFPKLMILKYMNILKHFPNEILCFAPFFLMTSIEVFLYLG